MPEKPCCDLKTLRFHLFNNLFSVKFCRTFEITSIHHLLRTHYGDRLIFHHQRDLPRNRMKYALFIGKLQEFRRIHKTYFLPFSRFQKQTYSPGKLFQRFIRRAVLMTEEKRDRCFSGIHPCITDRELTSYAFRAIFCHHPGIFKGGITQAVTERIENIF